MDKVQSILAAFVQAAQPEKEHLRESLVLSVLEALGWHQEEMQRNQVLEVRAPFPLHMEGAMFRSHLGGKLEAKFDIILQKFESELQNNIQIVIQVKDSLSHQPSTTEMEIAQKKGICLVVYTDGTQWAIYKPTSTGGKLLCVIDLSKNTPDTSLKLLNTTIGKSKKFDI